jgi:hypothetical protein
VSPHAPDVLRNSWLSQYRPSPSKDSRLCVAAVPGRHASKRPNHDLPEKMQPFARIPVCRCNKVEWLAF